MRTLLKAVLFLGLVGAPAALFFLSTRTEMTLEPAPTGLGADTTLQVKTANPHGIRKLRAEVRQGTVTVEAVQELSANRFLFWREHLAPEANKLRVQTGERQGFKSGPAVLKVEAVANDFRGQTTSREFNVMIALEPPTLSMGNERVTAAQGGVGVVRFTAGGYYTEAGVRVGEARFRSFPLPASKNKNRRFALFAIPWDASADTPVVAYARNEAGQMVESPLNLRIAPQHFRKRDLKIDRKFLEKVVDEITPNAKGEVLDAFLHINRDIRQENNRALAALQTKTEEKFLWKEGFAQSSATKVEAFFADVRSYVYEGKKVDEQVHLGFDLASTKQAPVEAANAGQVVFANRLGIYGNCIVVDHGYGLQSIYGHLSAIEVKVGDRVGRRQKIGRTGTTGMAGGDHLHFSLQLDGVQVSPKEWLQASPLRKQVEELIAAGN